MFVYTIGIKGAYKLYRPSRWHLESSSSHSDAQALHVVLVFYQKLSRFRIYCSGRLIFGRDGVDPQETLEV